VACSTTVVCDGVGEAAGDEESVTAAGGVVAFDWPVSAPTSADPAQQTTTTAATMARISGVLDFFFGGCP